MQNTAVPISVSAAVFTASPPLVQLRDVTRAYGTKNNRQLGVDRVEVTIGRGELVAVVGPSGSGKSTLGSLIAGIDTPTSGSIVVDGERIDSLKRDRLARWRGRNVGIIFQDFHLLPTLTAVENVALSLKLSGADTSRSERRERARRALSDVGLADKEDRLPTELSGGEQQRVAVARALVTEPRLVVADEPTGSLDQSSGLDVFWLLRRAADRGTTVVMITHDDKLAGQCDRVIEMLDARIVRHVVGDVDAPGGAVDVLAPSAAELDATRGGRRALGESSALVGPRSLEGVVR